MFKFSLLVSIDSVKLSIYSIRCSYTLKIFPDFAISKFSSKVTYFWIIF